jgi:hypothetical protein
MRAYFYPSKNSSCDAGGCAARGLSSSACHGRGIAFFAVFSIFSALAPASVQASCGKGYIVVPASYGGAVVEAIVAKHRKAYAEQTNQGTPQPSCNGPGCREHAPTPYHAPVVQAKVKTKTEATVGVTAATDGRQVSVFVHDPDEALYSFEVAPPPTPPPNGSQVRATL